MTDIATQEKRRSRSEPLSPAIGIVSEPLLAGVICHSLKVHHHTRALDPGQPQSRKSPKLEVSAMTSPSNGEKL
ncbi:hypothetical protein Cob_v011465 [Colletotrichum orbiculare MAFF 240422]|uniref:Uncharacterized protein n=1 Tax=Colletotrichum orbiculare (strain 104-T / ATCC 96160 / CBS 514.97 / LARS 414 / MAFF 240422) TaxID=1213857 RepID=A0A484FBD4_COLOR|nr:hypothetical protein Cob_v011465 [Colletotrichum orbiculare MAFF 240422]